MKLASETPYEVIAQNIKLGFHTLCLLDVKAEENRYMRICEGLLDVLKLLGGGEVQMACQKEEKRRIVFLRNVRPDTS